MQLFLRDSEFLATRVDRETASYRFVWKVPPREESPGARVRIADRGSRIADRRSRGLVTFSPNASEPKMADSKPTKISPTVLVHDGYGNEYTVNPPGWMWVLAFALRGVPWALEEIESGRCDTAAKYLAAKQEAARQEESAFI